MLQVLLSSSAQETHMQSKSAFNAYHESRAQDVRTSHKYQSSLSCRKPSPARRLHSVARAPAEPLQPYLPRKSWTNHAPRRTSWKAVCRNEPVPSRGTGRINNSQEGSCDRTRPLAAMHEHVQFQNCTTWMGHRDRHRPVRFFISEIRDVGQHWIKTGLLDTTNNSNFVYQLPQSRG